jgi:hypothetical protein
MAVSHAAQGRVLPTPAGGGEVTGTVLQEEPATIVWRTNLSVWEGVSNQHTYGGVLGGNYQVVVFFG